MFYLIKISSVKKKLRFIMIILIFFLVFGIIILYGRLLPFNLNIALYLIDIFIEFNIFFILLYYMKFNILFLLFTFKFLLGYRL